MRYRRVVRAAVLVVLVSIGAVALGEGEDAFAQAPAGQGAEKTADEYVLEGRELAKAGNFKEAHVRYLEAWKRKQSYDIAGNLGLVELKLERWREAAEHLAYSEQNVPAVRDADGEKRYQRTRELFKEVRARVGGARVKVTTDDGRSAQKADVFVDGRLVGSVDAGGGVKQPLGLSEVFVDPGSRTFSASIAECADASAVLMVPKGGSVSVELVLSCRKRVSVPWMAAGYGVAALGVGVGVGALVHAMARDEDADTAWVDLYGTYGASACNPNGNHAQCDELTTADSDSQVFRGIAIGGFIAGGAAAILTTVYVLAGGSAPGKAEPSIQTAFSVGPDGGGAVVRGSF
jgi:hypothetical protein